MQISKFLLVIPFCFIAVFVFAQKNGEQEQNILKINLPALIVKNISVQYERKVGAKTSAALAVRYMPFSKLPFAASVDKFLNDPYTAYVDLNKVNIGAFGIAPEFRFYLGHKGALRGLYVGPFLNYSNYKTDLPVDYNGKTGIFNGNVQTFTGGIQLGAQWKLANKISLDWWIAGPNYGTSSGDLVFTGSLSQIEQSVMQDELEKLKQEVPFNFIKSYTVGDNGATMTIKGPWAGVRGGFSLGFNF